MKVAAGGGLEEEGESIQLCELPVEHVEVRAAPSRAHAHARAHIRERN